MVDSRPIGDSPMILQFRLVHGSKKNPNPVLITIVSPISTINHATRPDIRVNISGQELSDFSHFQLERSDAKFGMSQNFQTKFSCGTFPFRTFKVEKTINRSGSVQREYFVPTHFKRSVRTFKLKMAKIRTFRCIYIYPSPDPTRHCVNSWPNNHPNVVAQREKQHLTRRELILPNIEEMIKANQALSLAVPIRKANSERIRRLGVGLRILRFFEKISFCDIFQNNRNSNGTYRD